MVNYDIYSKSSPENEKYRKDVDILNLLAFTGYLTRENSKNTYAVPNIEVKIDFYNQFFFSWMKAALNLDTTCDFSKSIKCLTTSLEDLPEYLNIIQEKILMNLTQAKASDANVRNLLGAIEMYASLHMCTPSHTLYSEMSNQSLQKLNFIFKPKPEKSNAYIIHKYKNIDSEIGVEDSIENIFWKIYSEKHISSVLRDIDSTNEAFIVIRAFVFYRSELGEWLVNAKGFKHDFNQAKDIDAIFSAVNYRLLKQINNLSDKEDSSMNDYHRVNFLRTHGASNIYEILTKYSFQEPTEINEKIKKYRKLY